MVLGAANVACPPLAPAQDGGKADARSLASAAASKSAEFDQGRVLVNSGLNRARVALNLPNAPGEVSSLEVPRLLARGAMAAAGGNQPFEVEPAVTVHQQPFSRANVGVDISTLGIGVESGILLTQIFDARLMGHFLGYNSGRIEVDNFNVYGGVHMDSAGIAADLYPWNAPIRLSAGLMFFNNNHAAGDLRLAAGANFTLNNEEFWAAGGNAVPLTGSVELAFHTIRPAPTLTFGFGKFIPRSNRHWSFPSEFGVAFTGTPTINVNFAGTVCTNAALTNCSNLSNTANPIVVEFNNALKAKEASWRHSLSRVPYTPILGGGVTYSFDTPWQGKPSARF